MQCVIHAFQYGALMPLLRSISYKNYGRLGAGFRLYQSVRTFAEVDAIDLVHAQFGPNGCKAVLAKKINLIECPIIVSFHGYDAHFSKGSMLAAQERYSELFRCADKFVVNGEYLKHQLLSLGCPVEKITIIRNGVDTSLFAPPKIKSRGGRLRLISVGRLIKLKNHALGIRAIKWLLDKGVEAEYTLIGDGEELNSLKSVCKQLGVEDRVFFLGALGQEAIAAQLKLHEIFLMTSSMDGEGRQETQGIVSAEAQACGLPVVGLDLGGVASTVNDGETGFIVPIEDDELYFEKILLLADEKLRLRFSGSARELVCTTFNIRDTEKKFQELFKSMYV